MSNIVLIAYLLSTIFSVVCVVVWRKFSSSFVDSFIVAISSWLTFLSIFNLAGSLT